MEQRTAAAVLTATAIPANAGSEIWTYPDKAAITMLSYLK